MSMLLTGLLEEEFASSEKTNLYVDDVYRTHTYIGNGTSQDLDLGIDFTKHGGVVLFKNRDASQSVCLHSTLFGATKQLYTHVTNALETIPTGLTTFTNTGVSVGSNVAWNASGQRHVAWVFREAPRFFTQRLVNHAIGTPTMVDLSSLGTVGCVIFKAVNGSGVGYNWYVAHRSLNTATTDYMALDLASAVVRNNQGPQISGTNLIISATFPTGQYFVMGFAHDTSADGMIQCGIYTGTGDNGPAVELGFEPQWLLFKAVDMPAHWALIDSVRGINADGTISQVQYVSLAWPDVSQGWGVKIDPNGFATVVQSNENNYAAGQRYIYIAIRRPNKPALQLGASKVFCPVGRTGTGAAATVTAPGFPADTVVHAFRANAGWGRAITSRLRGGTKSVDTTSNGAEGSTSTIQFDVMQGWGFGSNYANESSYTYIHYAFKRAPGFFDEVCWTASGTVQTHPHGLASPPGMMWTKTRSITGSWAIYHKSLGADRVLYFDASSGTTLSGFWGTVTGTTFQYQATAGAAMTTLLFGDTPGLCKAGSFTLGTTPWTETCGFSPRLVILKRTDAAGDWYVWDTARGIVAGNDPYLLLNATAAEVTGTDHIDPATNGFIINPTLPAGSYVYWACA